MSHPWIRPAVLALSTALATGCSDSSTPPAAAPTPRLVILATTDEHSHLFAGAPERDDHPLPHLAGTGRLKGGVARRHTLLLAERAAATAHGIDTLTLSAGDVSQGTLAGVPFSVTAPELVLMARLGYDAIAIGNHEFDLGLGALAASITAGLERAPGHRLPPLLLSNVTFPATPGSAEAPLRDLFGERGSGKPLVRSAMLTTAGGIKVGLVSDLGPSAAYVAPLARPLAFAGTVADYTDKPAAIAAIAAQLQTEIDGLRGAGASVVILLGHGGIAAAPAQGDDQLLAAALRGVDLVLTGHTHRQPDGVIWATDAAGKQVPLLQPAPFGLEVVRAELVLEPGQVRLDTAPALTRFIPVDDTIVPTTDAGVLGELDGVIYALESMPTGATPGPSFLEQTLTLVETVAHGGVTTPVADDPAVLGDLFYRTIGHTSFEVVGLRAALAGVQSGESSGLNLDTDAMWAVANGFSTTTTTQVAVQASGPMRGNLIPGKTGEISFADAYNVVPLGGDPVELSPGYPLVRFHLAAAELWGAFEFSLLFSMQDSDFYLSPAGLEVVFDRGRTPFNPATRTGGWITRLTLIDRAGTRETIFDTATAPPGTGGWLIDPMTRLVSVVTTYYVAAFAQSAGITPRDATGAPVTDLDSTILAIPGQSAHWKDHQALAAYVAFLDAAYWTLPSRYDEGAAAGRVPQRVLCTGPVCP